MSDEVEVHVPVVVQGKNQNLTIYDELDSFLKNLENCGALTVYKTDPNHGSSSSSSIYTTKQVVEDFRKMVKK